MPLLEIKTSNRDLLTDSTSGLSVALAAGKLDPRAVLRELNGYLEARRLQPREQVYLEGVKRQLIFREFARSALPLQEYRFPPGALGEDSEAYRQLAAGTTGIPIVDACVTDLQAGRPHNRARLLLARFAIRNLNLDPELVAVFYRRHLRDYCPVINTFNIVSAASGATFGEPCYRLSNPLAAAKKLDPENRYLARFGFASPEPTAAGLALIKNGSVRWKARWQAARDSGSFIRHRLWPTRDRERGIYFILDLIPARGAFAPYYRQYLQRERELLST